MGQSLYLYMLFIGSTSSLRCISATLKQYISVSDKYISASNISLKDQYVSYLFLPLMSAVPTWVNMSNNLCLKTYRRNLISPKPSCYHTMLVLHRSEALALSTVSVRHNSNFLLPLFATFEEKKREIIAACCCF